MSHLSPERLAALIDEPPTAVELSHLAGCAECARERDAYGTLADLAHAEPALGVPVTRWESLVPALERDGIIDRGRGWRRQTVHRGRGWLQAAAAVLLVAGGMAAGRLSVGAEPIPMAPGDSMVATTPVMDDQDPATFQSVAEAEAARVRSERMYQASLAWLAQNDTAGLSSDTPAAMKTRLAALDRVSETIGAALEESPYDPVINGYYLATVGEREATIRRLNTALPGAMRLTTY